LALRERGPSDLRARPSGRSIWCSTYALCLLVELREPKAIAFMCVLRRTITLCQMRYPDMPNKRFHFVLPTPPFYGQKRRDKYISVGLCVSVSYGPTNTILSWLWSHTYWHAFDLAIVSNVVLQW
jgi:hypothetical protein